MSKRLLTLTVNVRLEEHAVADNGLPLPDVLPGRAATPVPN